MIVINLYASQIASFIGKNPYTPSIKIFLKLWKTYFMDLQDVKESEKKKVKSLDKSDKDHIKKYEKKLDADLIKNIESICKKTNKNIELKKEQKKLMENIKGLDKLSDFEKKELNKSVEGMFNKSFGTRKEVNAFEYYKDNISNEIIKNIQQKNVEVFTYKGYQLNIIGKLDAMKLDGTIIEIKNRMYKLFDEIREYEWIQIQTYLFLYKLSKGEIVEFMNQGRPVLKVHPVKRDVDYWEIELLPNIIAYFKTLVDLMIYKEYREKVLKLSEQEQVELIKKLVREKEKI